MEFQLKRQYAVLIRHSYSDLSRILLTEVFDTEEEAAASLKGQLHPKNYEDAQFFIVPMYKFEKVVG